MPKAIARPVSGITCGDCPQMIEGVVGALPGVTVAEVNARAGVVAVIYDVPAEPAGIEAAVLQAGYRITQHTEGKSS
ncbi:heavy-metal-associated domain-containing protein [Streptomyces sp. A3M-1-3]|uniref:heavy-metal-associated domain-containing protein n=1 Tax=Streptomyces sp. A3M-1-3 TaxID=2962044 RepID=UPI0020B8C29D|nr:heavy metal-associated domain-containing protein [Streptomyces sp. A3M-1-3]MCP3818818.1 heavy-metal-associated domain-containing protein [Streptomyces sp. A3M-1-3]